jgi:hypothetical protein
MKKNKLEIISLDTEDIRKKIFIINGFQVMLDSDLAKLYNLSTKSLNQSVKRNIS